MEKKQTAVELLVNKLNKEGFAPVLTDEEIQQAKQMEKDQITDAYYQGSGDEAEEHGKEAILDLTDSYKYFNTYYGDNND